MARAMTAAGNGTMSRARIRTYLKYTNLDIRFAGAKVGANTGATLAAILVRGALRKRYRQESGRDAAFFRLLLLL